MLIPIKCYTCGKVLADMYLYYKKELKRKELAFKADENNNNHIYPVLLVLLLAYFDSRNKIQNYHLVMKRHI